MLIHAAHELINLIDNAVKINVDKRLKIYKRYYLKNVCNVAVKQS